MGVYRIPNVSIVIPIFNAENYIEKCVRSLFQQTLEALEFIFIDDNSKDRSVEIIKEVLREYPNRQSQTKFIYHAENEGVSKSRQDGVNVASGEYIIHCDADDWVDKEMYEKLYYEAIRNNSEVVVCGFYEVYEDRIKINEELLPLTRQQQLSYLINGKLHGSLCNKLVHHSLYKRLRLKIKSKILLWEDLYTCVNFFLKGKNIKAINLPLYYYRRNQTSITMTLNSMKIDSMIEMGKEMILALKNIEVNDDFKRISNQIAFNAKKNLLITGNGCYDPTKWRNEFKEYNKYWYKVEATPLLRFFYLMTLLHLDFVTKIYVSRPPILLKIHRLIKRR